MEERYSDLFRTYRQRGHSLTRSIASSYSLFDTIEKLLKEYDNGNVFPIEDFFMNNRNPKRSAQLILLDFNRFLQSRKKKKFDGVELEGLKYYSTDVERRFALLKEIHEPKSVASLSETFNIGRRTVSDYINAFEDGFEFMDSTVRIHIERRRRKDFCRSTAHPLFLALNSTELNHLMSYLDSSKDPAIRRVGDLIYSQLSDYAKKYICADVEGHFRSDESGYRDEYAGRDLIGYLQKCLTRNDARLFDFEYWDSESGRHLERGSLYSVKYEENCRMVTIKCEDGRLVTLPDDEIYILVDWDDIYR